MTRVENSPGAAAPKPSIPCGVSSCPPPVGPRSLTWSSRPPHTRTCSRPPTKSSSPSSSRSSAPAWPQSSPPPPPMERSPPSSLKIIKIRVRTREEITKIIKTRQTIKIKVKMEKVRVKAVDQDIHPHLLLLVVTTITVGDRTRGSVWSQSPAPGRISAPRGLRIRNRKLTSLTKPTSKTTTSNSFMTRCTMGKV